MQAKKNALKAFDADEGECKEPYMLLMKMGLLWVELFITGRHQPGADGTLML